MLTHNSNMLECVIFYCSFLINVNKKFQTFSERGDGVLLEKKQNQFHSSHMM